MLYRSKPSQIEAVRWLGDNWHAVEDFAGVRVSFKGSSRTRCMLLAGPAGASGWVVVPKGTWIVRDVETGDDYWPLAHQQLRDKYEPAR